MVTLIAIDNEQSLLLGEVHCRSQEKRGKKITLACRVGLWEKGKQIKVLLLCMSLQELCAMHQEIWFFTCTMTLLKSRDYLQSIILKNGNKLLENQHEKAVPYLENGPHLVKNKLGTSISLFLVAKAYLTWQVLSRIPGQKVIFHFYLSLLQDWNPTQQTILQLLFATSQQPEI